MSHLPHELEALAASLDALGAAHGADAPPDLERRLADLSLEAFRGLSAASPSPTVVVGRIGPARLRAAASIALLAGAALGLALLGGRDEAPANGVVAEALVLDELDEWLADAPPAPASEDFQTLRVDFASFDPTNTDNWTNAEDWLGEEGDSL